jgi:hypothetical protein
MSHQYLALARIIIADAHQYDYNKFARGFSDTWTFINTGIEYGRLFVDIKLLDLNNEINDIDERIAEVFIAAQRAAENAKLSDVGKAEA